MHDLDEGTKRRQVRRRPDARLLPRPRASNAEAQRKADLSNQVQPSAGLSPLFQTEPPPLPPLLPTGPG